MGHGGTSESGSDIGGIGTLIGLLFGGGGGSSGSGLNEFRENEFRGRKGFKAPTGDCRDIHFPRRGRELIALLGEDGRIGLSILQGNRDHDQWFGVDELGLGVYNHRCIQSFKLRNSVSNWLKFLEAFGLTPDQGITAMKAIGRNAAPDLFPPIPDPTLPPPPEITPGIDIPANPPFVEPDAGSGFDLFGRITGSLPDPTTFEGAVETSRLIAFIRDLLGGGEGSSVGGGTINVGLPGIPSPFPSGVFGGGDRTPPRGGTTMPVGAGLNIQNISGLLGSGAALINAIRGQGGQVQQGGGGGGGGFIGSSELQRLAATLAQTADPSVRERLGDLIGGDRVGVTAGAGAICAVPGRTMTRSFPATVQGLTTTESGATKVVTYKNMGTPILFSGDLAAVARVKRAASRANKACPTARRSARRGRR